ncbi:MAG TPA: DNA translocase FtsK 4TM domain-containing protein, partial [Clostridia bacterium]|nr:DNA translocase FtsK 4TM domain-containing protein [Clostridia bacterium]
MAQKKKPVKKGKKRPSLFKEVVGILVIMFGVLVFFAIFFEASTGVFGKITSNVLSGLLGWTYRLFPFLIVLLGIFLIFTSYEINWERRSVLILLSLLLISCFFQLTHMAKDVTYYAEKSFFRKLIAFYTDGADGMATGGVLGGIVTNPLIAIFGINGTYVILIAIALIFVILITNGSFREFFIHVRDGIKWLFRWMLDSFKPIDEQPGAKKTRSRKVNEP